MSPVAISADKRFHRAHVKPARKRSRLNAIAIPMIKAGLIAAFVLLLIYRGGTVLAEAPLLRIDQIVVNGNHRLTTADVLGALHGLRGENIVWSDLDAWRERLVGSPWVRDATFRRSLPSTVEVIVAEREPIGIGRLKGQLFLVDERGRVIDDYGPQYADLDLPIIDACRPRRAATRTPIAASLRRGSFKRSGQSRTSRAGCRKSTSPISTTPRSS
jgi:cell division septal protein FtsQ